MTFNKKRDYLDFKKIKIKIKKKEEEKKRKKVIEFIKH